MLEIWFSVLMDAMMGFCGWLGRAARQPAVEDTYRDAHSQPSHPC